MKHTAQTLSSTSSLGCGKGMPELAVDTEILALRHTWLLQKIKTFPV